ncbi:MAG: peptide-methionine (S)-S-oxide reductase, partial [Comamonas sp.]
MENKLQNQQDSNLETIFLGGGCFWCTEAVFDRVRGVMDVQSGYANGHV